MLNKRTMEKIDTVIDELVKEHNGDLPLFPHLDEIALRSGVTVKTLKQYLIHILTSEDDNINNDNSEDGSEE